MHYVNYRSLFLFNIILIMLSGCSLYKRNYLKSFALIEKEKGYCRTLDNQTLFIKALGNQESTDYFEADLISQGYMPLYIRITNDSPDTLIIRSSYIDLVPCSSQSICKLLHYDTSLYTCGLAAPALIFWWPATIAVGALGYDMYRANQKTNSRVDKCTLYGQSLEILPYEIVEKFMFIHSADYKSCFNFKIFNKDQKKLLDYHVNLLE